MLNKHLSPFYLGLIAACLRVDNNGNSLYNGKDILMGALICLGAPVEEHEKVIAPYRRPDCGI